MGSSPTASASVTEAIRNVRNLLGRQAAAGMPLVGSSPTASAFGVMVQQEDASTACWSDQRFASVPGATPGDSTQHENGPVAQRRRRHPYKVTIGGSSPPRTTLRPRYANRAQRLGLNPSVCGFESRPGHNGSVGNGRPPWLRPRDVTTAARRCPVRVPPEPLKKHRSSWSSLECSPACHAGDRGFKSRRGRCNEMARYANRQSGQAQTLVTCGFESRLCHSKHTRVGWASASPTACKAASP